MRQILFAAIVTALSFLGLGLSPRVGVSHFAALRAHEGCGMDPNGACTAPAAPSPTLTSLAAPGGSCIDPDGCK